MEDDEDFAIGIDLGTTYSCVAVLRKGEVEIIPNDFGENTTPSIVSFTNEGILVGDGAIKNLITNPKNTVYSIKRLMGRLYDDKEVERDIKSNFWIFDIIKKKNRPAVKIERENEEPDYYFPEQISKFILKKLVLTAENYLKQSVNKAVITVPAYFNDGQRKATEIAAIQAGLKVLRIINEPTAASLAYGLEHKFPKKENLKNPLNINNENKCKPSLEFKKEDSNNGEDKFIIVFDLGGGTFDVTLLSIKEKEEIYNILATSGDSHLGGDDFDKKIMDFCLKEFCHKLNIKEEVIRKDIIAMNRLKIASTKAKISLSTETETEIYIDEFYNNEILNIKLTRKEFEDICIDLFNKLLIPIDKVLDQAQKGISDINEIVFVGGSTKIPRIKEMIKNTFFDININDSINPEETVAYGAAIEAAKLNNNDNEILNDISLNDIVPFSLGINIANLSEDLDIKKKGHLMSVIIPKGAKIPITKTEEYETTYDNQESTLIDIYEGENKYVKDNHFLGSFNLVNLPKKPKGEVIIKVTFSVNSNGIFEIEAVEKEKGTKNHLTIINDKSLVEKDLIENINRTKIIVNNKGKNQDYFTNIKKEMNKFHKEFMQSYRDDDKYTYIDNYNKSLFKFIKSFDKEGNDTLGNKYFLYIKSLFNSYRIQIQLKSILPEEDKNLIIDNSKDLLKILSSFKNIYYKQYIDLLDNFVIDLSEKEKNESIDYQNKTNDSRNKILFNLVIIILEILEEKAEKILLNQSKLSKYNSKQIFQNCISISQRFIKSERDLYKHGDLSQRYNVCMENCKKKIKELNANSLFEIDKSKDTGKLFETKDNIIREELLIILDNYREAFQIIKGLDDNKSKAIILANIVKIKFKYLKKDNYRKLYNIALKSLYFAKMINEDYNSFEWYKELIIILEELKIKIDEQKKQDEEEFENKYKEEKKQIFEELQKYRNKSHLDFIKFILEKYPPRRSPLKKNQTVEKEWNKNPKSLLEILSARYNPDNLQKIENAKDKNEEEKLKLNYTIYHKISSEINLLLLEYNND